MRHALLTILFVATVLLAGCAHTTTKETVGQKIIMGETTKQEILDRFGAPRMKYRTPGLSIVSGQNEQMLLKPGEAWFYYVRFLGTLDIIEQETLRIQFNKGIVSYYTITNAAQIASP